MTRSGRIDIGHLAPITLNQEMLRIVCGNIKQARAEVAAPFIIENIAYTLRMPGAELSEAEFLSRVVETTDSGLLLDLMNLHANSQNHDYDPYEFLASIPLERVVQVHIIGGHYHHGVLIDSHSHRTPEEVWRRRVRRAANRDQRFDRGGRADSRFRRVGEGSRARGVLAVRRLMSARGLQRLHRLYTDPECSRFPQIAKAFARTWGVGSGELIRQIDPPVGVLAVSLRIAQG
jgi:hypothetical protein